MSREVRRVPVDWKHPVEHNPYWLEQSLTPYGRNKPLSWLRAKSDRFIGLLDDYPGALARWEDEIRELRARQGHSWTFGIEYYLTGYQGHDDTEPKVHPFHVWAEDDKTEIPIQVRDEEHLFQLQIDRKLEEKPDPKDYMPVFDVPKDELGWVLYETVSEGTPCTPVFKTAEELIEHLCIIGQDHNQVPMRRQAAKVLVRSGWAPSAMAVGGVFYKGDEDADKLAALPKAADQ